MRVCAGECHPWLYLAGKGEGSIYARGCVCEYFIHMYVQVRACVCVCVQV